MTKNNKPISETKIKNNVRMEHARDGKVLNEREFHNAPLGTILSRLAYAIASGNETLKLDNVGNTIAAGRDGIGAFSAATNATKNTAASMQLLKGATVAAATNNNQVIFSASNALTTVNVGSVISAFALGHSAISASNDTGQAFNTPLFTHDLGSGGSFTFANNDTLSVTWTVSVTT